MILFMVNEITCSCGAPKAPRARVCFTCLAAEPRVACASIREKIAGEAGPRFFACRADGTMRTFAIYSQAAEWVA